MYHLHNREKGAIVPEEEGLPDPLRAAERCNREKRRGRRRRGGIDTRNKDVGGPSS